MKPALLSISTLDKNKLSDENCPNFLTLRPLLDYMWYENYSQPVVSLLFGLTIDYLVEDAYVTCFN